MMRDIEWLRKTLEWRLEHFDRLLSALDLVYIDLVYPAVEIFKRERAILAFCAKTETRNELETAWTLALWGCRAVDCILNYESSNANSAIRHIDSILGEKNV